MPLEDICRLTDDLWLSTERQFKGTALTYMKFMDIYTFVFRPDLAMSVVRAVLLRRVRYQGKGLFRKMVRIAASAGEKEIMNDIIHNLRHKGTNMNVKDCHAIVSALATIGDTENALDVLNDFQSTGEKAPAAVFATLCLCFGRSGKKQEGLSFISDICANNSQVSLIDLQVSLMHGLHRRGDMSEMVLEVYGDICLQDNSEVPFKAKLMAICALGRLGKLSEAMSLFDEMNEKDERGVAVWYMLGALVEGDAPVDVQMHFISLLFSEKWIEELPSINPSSLSLLFFFNSAVIPVIRQFFFEAETRYHSQGAVEKAYRIMLPIKPYPREVTLSSLSLLPSPFSFSVSGPYAIIPGQTMKSCFDEGISLYKSLSFSPPSSATERDHEDEII